MLRFLIEARGRSTEILCVKQHSISRFATYYIRNQKNHAREMTRFYSHTFLSVYEYGFITKKSMKLFQWQFYSTHTHTRVCVCTYCIFPLFFFPCIESWHCVCNAVYLSSLPYLCECQTMPWSVVVDKSSRFRVRTLVLVLVVVATSGSSSCSS